MQVFENTVKGNFSSSSQTRDRALIRLLHLYGSIDDMSNSSHYICFNLLSVFPFDTKMDVRPIFFRFKKKNPPSLSLLPKLF